jgi:hypothetical protein
MRKSMLSAAGCALIVAIVGVAGDGGGAAARTQKPGLHAKKWLAITGKPLAATAGARMFEHGGNAVDAACAMLAATCTMWDTLSWGGETQALVWNPKTGKVQGVNALGVAPTGATADFFKGKGLRHPPEFGPLAAVTPGTPGGLMLMLAEWGKLPLSEVLAPAIDMAEEGYPIEEELVWVIGRERERLASWPWSKTVFLPHDGQPPVAGELFRQPDLARTLRRLVEAERTALAAGKDRKAAIMAAYDLFYKGDVARDLAQGAREVGALSTREDLGALIASFWPMTRLCSSSSIRSSLADSASVSLNTGMPVAVARTSAMSSSLTSATASMSPAFHSFSRTSLRSISCFSLSRSAAAFSKSWESMADSLSRRTSAIFSSNSRRSGGAVIRRMRIREPASSIRSIALSGRNLSLTYRAES